MKKIVFLVLFFFLNAATSEEITENDRMFIELTLKQTLKRIKEYKIFKNNQISKLNNDLIRTKNEFSKHRKNQKYEIQKLRKQLFRKNKELQNIKQKKPDISKDLLLKELREKLRRTEKKLSQKNKKLKIIKEKNLDRKKDILLKKLRGKLRRTEKKLLQKDKKIKIIEEECSDTKITIPIRETLENNIPLEQKHQILTKEKDLSRAVNIAMEKAMNSSAKEPAEWVEIVIED